ncbi:MAG: hypothetical protein EOP04_02295 [Proteobacteria bacterium]|nr:MAG: hypothetical protein EOP04_02295 [Pseudomonadota bacterium]
MKAHKYSLILIAAFACTKKPDVSKKEEILNEKVAQQSFPFKAIEAAKPVFIAGGPHQSDHLPFEWSLYSDPSRPEFWADGADGVLPRPFLQLAGEPTVENAKKLLTWQEAQWKAIESIIKALGGAKELETYSDLVGENFLETLSRKDQTFQLAKNSALQQKVSLSDKADGIEWNNVGVVYIYRSKCHACQQQTPIVKALMEMGARVIPLQIEDGGPPSLPNSQPYSKAWASHFPLGNEEVTPTFFFHVKGHEPKKHPGFISLRDITSHVKTTVGDNI